MVTEKQKCIAEQAIYGDLAIKDIDCTEPLLEIVLKCGWDSDEFLIDTNIDFDLTDTDRIKPILRPLSDLTKEITHNGYNDDKPFIPLIKLAEINFILRPQDGHYTLQNGDYGYGIYFNYKSYRERARCFFLQVYEKGVLQAFSTDIKSHSPKSNTAKHCGLNAKEIVDLLHLWHFDTRSLIKKGEASVLNTLDINPYSV